MSCCRLNLAIAVSLPESYLSSVLYPALTPQAYTWQTASLFILTGGCLYYYFTSEKAKVEERRRE